MPSLHDRFPTAGTYILQSYVYVYRYPPKADICKGQRPKTLDIWCDTEPVGEWSLGKTLSAVQ